MHNKYNENEKIIVQIAEYKKAKCTNLKMLGLNQERVLVKIAMGKKTKKMAKCIKWGFLDVCIGIEGAIKYLELFICVVYKDIISCIKECFPLQKVLWQN